MRKYNKDDKQSVDKFFACPVDGPRKRGSAAAPSCDFSLTLVSDACLTTRLANEVQFVVRQLRQIWPSFRRHPVAFIGAKLRELRNALVKTINRPHVVSGSAASLLLVFTTILTVLILEKRAQKAIASFESDDVSLTEVIDFHSQLKSRIDRGVGAGQDGRGGLDNGRGGGSRPEPARPPSGGSGGMRNHYLPSQAPQPRSEERRVGKEGRSRWSPYH